MVYVEFYQYLHLPSNQHINIMDVMLLDYVSMLLQVISIQLKNQSVIPHSLPIHVFLIFHVFDVYYFLYQLILLLMHHMMVIFLLQYHLENVVYHLFILFYFILCKRTDKNKQHNTKPKNVFNYECQKTFSKTEHKPQTQHKTQIQQRSYLLLMLINHFYPNNENI